MPLKRFYLFLSFSEKTPNGFVPKSERFSLFLSAHRLASPNPEEKETTGATRKHILDGRGPSKDAQGNGTVSGAGGGLEAAQVVCGQEKWERGQFVIQCRDLRTVATRTVFQGRRLTAIEDKGAGRGMGVSRGMRPWMGCERLERTVAAGWRGGARLHGTDGGRCGCDQRRFRWWFFIAIRGASGAGYGGATGRVKIKLIDLEIT
ncbi:ATP-dependent helicase [Sesbania bispinosa]|nr:ATP-dependent helicase [Sesbania bispinosa]